MTRPAIFSSEPFDEAVARARRDAKLLIVDATASWCQPCQVMDRVTWSAAEVAAWITEHAIAIQIDVDEQKDVAERFAVRAMPTVVVLRDSTELDRVSGLQKPDELLAWLDGLVAGKTSLDTLRARTTEAPVDVRARWQLANRLVETGDLDGACEELVWFWEHALEHDPAFLGVRGSYALAVIAKLVERSAGARERFVAIRDRLDAAVGRDDVDARTLDDWIALSVTLGDSGAVCAWAARAPDPVIGRADLARVVGLRLLPLLVAREQWEDLCRAVPDPLAHARADLKQHAEVASWHRTHAPPEMAGEGLGELDRMFATKHAQLHRALTLTGRHESADALARELSSSPLAEAFAQARRGEEGDRSD